MQRGLTFGAVAAAYDQTRPSYPDRLVADVVDLLPGPSVLEVGAGTGKATVSFASYDLSLTCIEPDPAMAAMLTANCAVPVVISTFEAWHPLTGGGPAAGRFDGLISGQAWHWTDPATRCDRAAEVLRTGALVALFFNSHEWVGEEVRAGLREAYDRHGIGDRPNGPLWTADAWPGTELDGHAAFDYLGVRGYEWEQTYAPVDYVTYLNTTSHHLVMREEQRAALTADLLQALPERVRVERRTDLYLARRR
jgi:SAM-dependent methyltransferase